MDLQKMVDSIDAMTCVMSVEDLGNGRYGDIRIITGNKAYIDSVEQPSQGVELLVSKFIPNSLYTQFFTKDLNFEYSCYQAAVEKKVVHAYVHPDRFDVWFNLVFMPIAWEEGDLRYCTYTMEITKAPDSSKMSAISGEIASSVLETCIKLRGTIDFRAGMQDVIRDIRKLCEANRCCVLLLNEEQKSCSILCEDLADNSLQKSMTEILDDSSYALVESWKDIISGSNCLIAKNEQDMEVVKQRNPQWYQSLAENHVSTIALFPLKFNKKLLGYIWATNFNPSNAAKIKETMEVTTFILGSEISNYLMLKQLHILSSQDMLTRVQNRNQMNNIVEALSNGSISRKGPLGILFADLNGLKAVNDMQGHKAGDRLLKDAASALREVFRPDNIFRAGGDEFVIIETGITHAELEEKVQALRKAEEKYDNLSFAIGFHVEDNVRDVRKALQDADVQMYEDKKNYYETHSHYRNRS